MCEGERGGQKMSSISLELELGAIVRHPIGGQGTEFRFSAIVTSACKPRPSL